MEMVSAALPSASFKLLGVMPYAAKPSPVSTSLVSTTSVWCVPRPLPFHSNIVLARGQEKFIAWGRVNMFDQPSVQ